MPIQVDVVQLEGQIKVSLYVHATFFGLFIFLASLKVFLSLRGASAHPPFCVCVSASFALPFLTSYSPFLYVFVRFCLCIHVGAPIWKELHALLEVMAFTTFRLTFDDNVSSF